MYTVAVLNSGELALPKIGKHKLIVATPSLLSPVTLLSQSHFSLPSPRAHAPLIYKTR